MITKFKIFENAQNEIDPYGEEIWEDPNIEEKIPEPLKEFLIKHNCLESYMKAILIMWGIDEIDEFFHVSEISQWIYTAIPFAKTDEGFEFWDNINQLWLNLNKKNRAK